MEFDFDTLGSYFEATETFFGKRFREESWFRLSAVSTVGDADENGTELKFSPRFQIPKNGDPIGKAKIGFTVDTGRWLLYQRVAVNNLGLIKAKLDFESEESDTQAQLTGGVALNINTIAPPADDDFTVQVGLKLPQFYVSGNANKSASGEGEYGVQGGVRIFNGIFGFEHSQPLQDDSHATCVGFGFSGEQYAAACKVTRTSAFSSANVALLRQFRRTIVVAGFDLDLTDDRNPGKVTVGVEHGLRLRLPSWLRESPLRLCLGIKGSTTGNVVLSLSSALQRLKYTIVANVERDAPPSFGISVRFE